MKKKIIGIIVCTLVIATATISLVSGKRSEKISENLMPSIIDQQQPNTPELYWLNAGVDNWQQFKNLGKTLEKVELHVGCYFQGSYPITLSIKETLSGTLLTQVTYQANVLPDNMQAWFTFDVPDVVLKANTIYYMILTFNPGSEYAWSGSHNDPYPAGVSSHPDDDWDFAFRTIVDKSSISKLNTPLLFFLGNHPNVFPLLRHLLGL